MFTSAIGNEVNSTTNSPIVTQPSNRPSQGENHHPFSAHTVSCTKDELKIRRKSEGTSARYTSKLQPRTGRSAATLNAGCEDLGTRPQLLGHYSVCHFLSSGPPEIYTFSCYAWFWNVDLICDRRFARIKRSLRQIVKKKYRLRNFRKMIG